MGIALHLLIHVWYMDKYLSKILNLRKILLISVQNMDIISDELARLLVSSGYVQAEMRY